MEYVNPIRDIEKINEIKGILRKSSLRDLLLFVLGINTGIAVQDLLNLTVKDVWDGSKVKEFLYIEGEKLGEDKSFYLNSNVGEAIQDYLASIDWELDDYLFKSKKNNLPISRQQAYRIINHAAKEVGIPENVGTQTLRKTFGYHAYQKGVAISIIKSVFNHHSTSETLKYLGIDKKVKRPIKVDVNL